MNARDTSTAVESLLGPVVEELGYELVELQLRPEAGRLVLRLLVDRAGGITLDECARLSREVGPHLDVADLIHQRYVLEVSSPGIRRPLRKLTDYGRFVDQRIEVHTVDPVDGRKTFRGLNLGVDEGGGLVVEEGPERRFRIEVANIRRANLDPELKF